MGSLDPEFPQGTDKSVFLENAYKVWTDDTVDNLRSRIQDKHPSISDVFVFICRRKPTKCGLESSSRSLNATKHPFPHKLFCPFDAKHGLLTEDAILIFEVYVIRSDCWPQSLKFKMVEMKIQFIDCINLPSVQMFIKDILILMFCTSLGQC